MVSDKYGKKLELQLITGLCTRLRIFNAILESTTCEEARRWEHSQIKNQVLCLGMFILIILHEA